MRTTSPKIDLGEFRHEIIEQQRKNQGIVGTRFSTNLMSFKDRNLGMVREIVHNYEIKEGAQEQETIMEIESNLNNIKNEDADQSGGNLPNGVILPADLLKERDEKISKQISNFQDVVMNGLQQLTTLTQKGGGADKQTQEMVQNIVNGIRNKAAGLNVNNQVIGMPEADFEGSDTNPITFSNSERRGDNIEQMGKDGLKDSYVGDEQSNTLNLLISNHGDRKDNFLKRGTLVVNAPTIEYTNLVRASLNDGDKDGKEKLQEIPEGMSPVTVKQSGLGLLGKGEISGGEVVNPFDNDFLKFGGKSWGPKPDFKKTQNFEENVDFNIVGNQISSSRRIMDFNKNIQEEGVDQLDVNVGLLMHHDQGRGTTAAGGDRLSLGAGVQFNTEGVIRDQPVRQESIYRESVSSNKVPDEVVEAKVEKQFNNYMNQSHREKKKPFKGKSFRATMENIYSDIDKTFDNIEVEEMNDSERDPYNKGFHYEELKVEVEKEEVKEEVTMAFSGKMRRFNSQVKLPLENFVKEEVEKEKRNRPEKTLLKEYEAKQEEFIVKPKAEVEAKAPEFRKDYRFKNNFPSILKRPTFEEKVSEEPSREIESNILSKYIKPSPKIYRRQRKGDKFLILAEDNDDLETRSYYSRSKNRAPSVNARSSHSRDPLPKDDWRNYSQKIRNRPHSAKPERVTRKKSLQRSGEMGLRVEESWGMKRTAGTRSEVAVRAGMMGNEEKRDREMFEMSGAKGLEGGNLLSQFSRVPTHAGTIRSSVETDLENEAGERKMARKEVNAEIATVKGNRPFDTPTVYSRSLTQKESKFRFLKRGKPNGEPLKQNENGKYVADKGEEMKGKRGANSGRRISWTIEKRKQRKPKVPATERRNRFGNRGADRQRAIYNERISVPAEEEELDAMRVSKVGTMSVEDMEAKLRVLFKKMLVYGSKIETIKLKIDKVNGETSCYALYRRFCDQESGELSLGGLRELLQALNFPVGNKMLLKMLIYLSKFEPSLPMATYHPSQTDVFIESPYMNFSEVHTASNNMFDPAPNFSRMNNITATKERDRASSAKGPRMFMSHEGTLGSPQSPENITLKYGCFRQLFTSHKIKIPEIYLFCNWESQGSRADVQIPESEYYLMRQILMLFQKQLKDMTRVMVSMRPYTAEQMFDYLGSYSPDNMQSPSESLSVCERIPTQITFSLKSDRKKSGRQSQEVSSLVPSFSNNHYMPVSPRSKQSNRMNGGVRGQFDISRKGCVADEVYGRQKRSQTMPGGLVGGRGVHEERERLAQVNVWNIKNFLEAQKVHYLEEDLMLLMNALASSEGSLKEATFYQFVYSPLWTL